jgi:hypothetical protein
MPRSVGWLSRRLTGSTLLLLVGWLLHPDQARASCGDYLIFHQIGLATSPDLIATTPRMPARDKTPKPCSGLSCSDRGAASAIPVTAVQTTDQLWLRFPNPIVPPTPEPDSTFPCRAVFTPVDTDRRPFRPPRSK